MNKTPGLNDDGFDNWLNEKDKTLMPGEIKMLKENEHIKILPVTDIPPNLETELDRLHNLILRSFEIPVEILDDGSELIKSGSDAKLRDWAMEKIDNIHNRLLCFKAERG